MKFLAAGWDAEGFFSKYGWQEALNHQGSCCLMWRGIVHCFLSKSNGNVNCVIVKQEELGEGLAIKLVFLRKSGVSRLESKKKL